MKLPAGTAVTDAEARYLVAIYRMWATTGGRVSTGAVAGRLDVRPASVTEMFGRLADRGLLAYDPHRGVEPMPAGAALARELSRRQCVVEGFVDAVDPVRALSVGRRLPEAGVERLGREVDHPCLSGCRADAEGFGGCPKVAVGASGEG